MIYLDYAAATPLDDRVIAVMRQYETEKFYNPSALYTQARQLRNEIDGYRARVASLIGAKPSEIYFTAGATESINAAIGGIVRMRKGSVAISAVEHSAVVESARGYSDKVEAIEVKGDGRVDMSKLASAISDEVCIVSIGIANSEVGTVQPIKEIASELQHIREDRHKRGVSMPLYFHSDASAAAGYIPLNVGALGVDLLSLNGAKIYGPKQSGVLYKRHDIEISPLIYGGNQERGLRSGSENPGAIAGFTEALMIAQSECKDESKRQKILKDRLMRGLRAIDGVGVNGSSKHRIAGNLHLSFAGIDGETLLHHLDAQGIMASTGAACKASSEEPSEVLRAIGCDEASIRGSLRLSLGRGTTEEEIDTVAEVMTQTVTKLRNYR